MPLPTYEPISALVQLALAGIKGGDWGVAVDVNDFTQAPSGSTKKFALADLRTAFMVGGALAGFATTDVLNVQGATITGAAVSINGLAYNFPAAQTANGFLKTDGAGNLTWVTEAAGISLAGLTDVALAGLANGQVLTYNSGTSKWNNSSTAALTSVGTLTVGLGGGAQANNTAYGVIALSQNSTGVANTAIGYHALGQSTTSAGDTAIGFQAMSGISTVGANVAVGYQTLPATSGTQNVAVGYWALQSCTTGSNNVGVGYNALATLISGQYNVGIGYGALNAATGSFNAAMGGFALFVNTGGTNVSVGYFSLKNNVSGSGNVAVGANAGLYELGSNAFYVNNQDRVNTAGDKALSLLYGTFASTAAAQTLAINAGTVTLAGTLAMSGAFTGATTGTFSTSLVVGTDPGGAAALRVGGNASFSLGTDVDQSINVGVGGTPTANRNALVVINGPSTGGFLGQQLVQFKQNGVTGWSIGQTFNTTTLYSSETSLGFFATSGTPVASLTTAGMLTTTLGHTTRGGAAGTFGTIDAFAVNFVVGNGVIAGFDTSFNFNFNGAPATGSTPAINIRTQSGNGTAFGLYMDQVNTGTSSGVGHKFALADSVSAMVTAGTIEFGKTNTWTSGSNATYMSRFILKYLSSNVVTTVFTADANTGLSTFFTPLTITGALAGVTSLTYSTSLISTTALGTPGALVATTSQHFASTTLGAATMGFGTTWDVSLLNRAGNVAVGIWPNALDVVLAGACSGAALATAATAGFLSIPTVAGTPTGVPTAAGAGKAQVVYNTTGKQIYVYDSVNAAWTLIS